VQLRHNARFELRACSYESLIAANFVSLVLLALHLDSLLDKIRGDLPQWRARDARVATRFLAPMLAAALLLVAPLYWTRFSLPTLNTASYAAQDGVWSAGRTAELLPRQLHRTTSFLFGINKVAYFSALTSPEFAGTQLRVPFIADFHAAAMTTAGASGTVSAIWCCTCRCVCACVYVFMCCV
jgi:hypothetical protein